MGAALVIADRLASQEATAAFLGSTTGERAARQKKGRLSLEGHGRRAAAPAPLDRFVTTRRRLKIWWLAGGVALCLSPRMNANITLPSLFSDHAVLQRSEAVPIWGRAQPGEEVTVALADEVATATTGRDGNWRATLNLSKTASGPFQLQVKGANQVEVSDVVIGEVWMCSGQSNMDWSVSRTIDADSAIAVSFNDNLRVFEPVRRTSARPAEELEGKWLVADPTVTGRFPAVGYFFGKALQDSIGGPVGLLSISWGGTPVEAWTSREALQSDPSLKVGSEIMRRRTDGYPAELAEYVGKLDAWEQKYERRERSSDDPGSYAKPGISTSDWTPVTLPGPLSRAGLPDAGVIWIRRQFPITQAMTVGPLFIELGILHDFDTAYLDGQKVGETTPRTAGAASPRVYYIEKAKEGEVTVAVRLVAPAGGAGVFGPESAFCIDGSPLSGPWLAKVEHPLPPASDQARAEYPAPMPTAPSESKTPSYVYNGMVAPVIPYGIKGVAWYQGEDNGPRALQYRTAFPLMINDWRNRWGEGAFPFFFCQLANYGKVSSEPADSAWAELREAQTRTLSLPNTGQAILLDLGEEADIHPRDKREVGSRLARIALAETYGRTIEYSGPVFESMESAGGALRLRFSHCKGGLVARAIPATYRPRTVDVTRVPRVRNSPGSEVEGFAICGADHVWRWADAAVDGASVVVTAKGVNQPIAVRYAWGDSPVFNLYNRDGLPAGPFRTDSFAGITDAQRYGQ
jgi:sialate O-acetylesterase